MTHEYEWLPKMIEGALAEQSYASSELAARLGVKEGYVLNALDALRKRGTVGYELMVGARGRERVFFLFSKKRLDEQKLDRRGDRWVLERYLRAAITEAMLADGYSELAVAVQLRVARLLASLVQV